MSLTVAVHTSAFKIALKLHAVEASEDAGPLELPLNKFTFIPEQTFTHRKLLSNTDTRPCFKKEENELRETIEKM